jgi:hypothetical protein
MPTRFALFSLILFVSSALAAEYSNSRINLQPGLWSDTLEMEGPGGDKVVMRDGQASLNGKAVTPPGLSPAELAEQVAASRECLRTPDIPTVNPFVNNLRNDTGDDFSSQSITHIIEATPNKIVYEGEFTSRFMSAEPYSGKGACTTSFEGERSVTSCEITWLTPPHAGKKSKLVQTGTRIATDCPARPFESDAAEDDDAPNKQSP